MGKVVPSFEARRDAIRAGLASRAAALNATLASDDALLDEVTALVEWPVVLEAGFAEDFLKVPQECLILTMQQNQKYFPAAERRRQADQPLPAGVQPGNRRPSHIIHGNERVLRARLSDAKFFFEQDQKQKLESRVPRLGNVVYHNQIGTQLERVERLESLAGQIAGLIGANVDDARRAARLAKADLVSDMVGEFPELQGIMGRYYARLDGENDTVAAAIEGHHHPRFAGDSSPVGDVAKAVALADKLETVVGIYGIGLIPTGDKDPFACAATRWAFCAWRWSCCWTSPAAGADRRRLPGWQAVRHRGRRCVWFMQERLKTCCWPTLAPMKSTPCWRWRRTRFGQCARRVGCRGCLPRPAGSRHPGRRQQAGENILKKVEGEVAGGQPGPC